MEEMQAIPFYAMNYNGSEINAHDNKTCKEKDGDCF
jgi:hypothetical protein